MLFSFRHRSPARTTAIQQALARTSPGSPALTHGLTILEQPGSYVGRHVIFFAAFDPLQAMTAGLEVRSLAELYAHPYLVMAAGHVERDGLVVLTDARDPDPRATPLRVPANRAAHLDDKRFVFPDRRLSASSRLPI